MPSSTSKLALRLIAPAATLLLLLGMVREQRNYLTEEDFAAYHDKAAQAIDRFSAEKRAIGSWVGSENEVVKEAQRLLKPNRILSLKYTDTSSGSIMDPNRKVSLLIVQCKRSGDMVGHYPRNCYRSIGNEMTLAVPRTFEEGGLRVPLTEYQFKRTENGRTYETIVYNFMIVPGRGVVADMEGVKAAAEDYQQRYYGAAQFQVVFHAPIPAVERDEIFSLFLRELVPTMKTLNSGEPR
jgi:hypothetical protein